MVVVATAVTFLGGYLYLAGLCLSIATGLYYLAEAVEENTRTSKRLIGYAIQVVIGLHILILVVDRLPLLPLAIGVAAHGTYWRLLKSFPFISLTAPDFLGSMGLLVANHIAWFRFFYFSVRVSVEWVLGFLLVMTWIVPLAFFISLSANEMVLPGAGSGLYPNVGAHENRADDLLGGRRGAAGSGRRSTLLGVFGFLRRKRDEVLPQVNARMSSAAHSHRF